MRSSLEIQENMFKRRKERIELLNGWTEKELKDHANNPKNYRKSRKGRNK